MQCIEASELGVRDATYRLPPRGVGPEFVLFPMIHAGSKEYYGEVSRRLEACDAIFLEGVSSRQAAYLTWTYKVLAKIKRLELVTQRSMDLSAYRHKLVNTDVTVAEFDRQWGNVPWWVQA